MPEIQLGAEAAEMLPKAVKDVSLLYVRDKIGAGFQTVQQRDALWQAKAKELSPFSEQILALRNSVKKAEIIKKGYPAMTIAGLELTFSSVGDDLGRSALVDIFMSRISTPGGNNIESNMDFVQESEMMIKELGIQDGSRGEQIKSVGLEKVVESVLIGKLKMMRQTH